MDQSNQPEQTEFWSRSALEGQGIRGAELVAGRGSDECSQPSVLNLLLSSTTQNHISPFRLGPRLQLALDQNNLNRHRGTQGLLRSGWLPQGSSP